MEFFFERYRQAATYQERALSKILSCEIYEIFLNSFVLEQLSESVSVSGAGLAQNIKYFIWLAKQINTPYK